MRTSERITSTGSSSSVASADGAPSVMEDVRECDIGASQLESTDSIPDHQVRAENEIVDDDEMAPQVRDRLPGELAGLVMRNLPSVDSRQSVRDVVRELLLRHA